MKKFIKRFILISILYLAISTVISYLLPYHWGNPWFSTKIQYLEKNKTTNHNTFFFGSSRVYRQMNPNVFDSVYNSISEEKLNSFNLGAPATFNPQCYYLYENFLNSPLSKEAKYCFMELMEVDLLADSFMHQERTSYWQNHNDMNFVGKSLFGNKQINKAAKIQSAGNYAVSYLESLLHLGHFGKQLLDSNYYNRKYLGNLKNGFFPLDTDLETTNDATVKKHLEDRRNRIIKKPQLLDNRKIKIRNSYKDRANNYDIINLARIERLIEESKEKGIRLIFILSPRNGSQELINLSRQIPKENLIDMANPEIYPEFYTPQNSFDVGHLNTKGASVYSKMLALKLGEKNN